MSCILLKQTKPRLLYLYITNSFQYKFYVSIGLIRQTTQIASVHVLHLPTQNLFLTGIYKLETFRRVKIKEQF